jgi:hypothetical protein
MEYALKFLHGLSGCFASLLTVTLLGAPLGCAEPEAAGADVNRFEELDGSLIGGSAATASDYPATVRIAGQCTGAKVGARHFLLAAHCVHNYQTHDSLWGTYTSGQTISITSAEADNGAGERSVTIEGTYVFPEWFERCAEPCAVNVLNAGHAPDVAVVVVREETPEIPIAPVDPEPVPEGVQVVVNGYGCEDRLNGSVPSPYRHKFAAVNALNRAAVDHPGAPWVDLEALSGSYLFTPGQGSNLEPGSPLDTQAASLCPGDSGGPVYRERERRHLVVGVNAYYTFNDAHPGVSVTNWHTRLDRSAQDGVLDWLRGLGVSVASASSPYGGVARSVTDVVQAEDYDAGGAQVAFSDTAANNEGGAYRFDGPDVEPSADAPGRYNVGYIREGEWLKYTVEVPNAGTYTLDLRVASPKGLGALRVELDGVTLAPAIALRSTGSWQSWTTLSVPNLRLPQGRHVLRFVFDAAGFNFNWFQFRAAPSCSDGHKNGAETDVDCGGSCALGCAEGLSCFLDADCASGVCEGGVCQAPEEFFTPCAGLCGAPVSFEVSSYQSGSLGPSATCHETTAWIKGISCGGFTGRALLVNGVAVSCSGQNVMPPPLRNGGYCFQASSGSEAWAWFATW